MVQWLQTITLIDCSNRSPRFCWIFLWPQKIPFLKWCFSKFLLQDHGRSQLQKPVFDDVTPHGITIGSSVPLGHGEVHSDALDSEQCCWSTMKVKLALIMMVIRIRMILMMMMMVLALLVMICAVTVIVMECDGHGAMIVMPLVIDSPRCFMTVTYLIFRRLSITIIVEWVEWLNLFVWFTCVILNNMWFC